MNETMAPLSLNQMGLDPVKVTSIVMIHQKHGCRLYRVQCGARSFVLKWFEDPTPTPEVLSYGLLDGLGVSTIQVHGRTDNALLLEDLTVSPTWRLATVEDMASRDTGVAVAEWYLNLHTSGRGLLAGPLAPPGFLRREADALDPETVIEIGTRLELIHDPVWTLAADHIEALKTAMRSLPETLNYNDFHWSNLALLRRPSPSSRAIVFDYHLLGLGLAYSDCRNVVGSLVGEAVEAFWDTYGPVNERERLLDEPVAILHALSVALNRPRWPGWAEGCLRKVKNGELEKSLRHALEIL